MPGMSTFPVRPQDIFEDLRKTVLGQEEALREISVAIVKHLVGHPAGNIFLVGNSGTGKTTLMRAVESQLGDRADFAPFSNLIRINANVLAEDREGSGRSILTRLYRNALRKLGPNEMADALRMVERGMVFIDEVDKIRAQVGGQPNTKGIVAQEALLTLMENENVEFEIEKPVKATVAVNSSSILFVAAGAFEELYDAVLRRATIGSDVVPLKPVTVVSQSGEIREELPFHLRDYLRYDDLFRYGMTPQFVSRFESVVVLNDLVEQDLARIFVEPEKSIFRVSREYFARFGIDLQITRGALAAIAWDAARQKRLGARALKDTWRRIIRDVEFDPFRATSPEPQDGPRTFTIDETLVDRAISRRDQGTA
jgi:ATP-dependent Clp protease ATP-binding subunit ClpX